MTSAHVRRRLAQGDAGFTLVETMVAIVIAGVLFMALAGVLITSLRATVLSRSDQQAIDLTTAAIESTRALDITQVGLLATDPDIATDPKIVANAYTVRQADGTSSSEPIVYVANSTLKHKTTQVLDNASYTVYQYVTTPPADATTGSSYVRLTVVVSWTTRGVAHEKVSSTFITNIRRGLPQPKFTWALTGTALADQATGIPISPGSILTVSTVLTNRGARDRWNVTTVSKDSSNATRNWQFAWYNDNGPGSEACNGVHDPDELTRMDPNNDGIADTNTVNTDEKVCLVGVYTVPVTESTGSSPVAIAITATSNAVSTISQTVTAKAALSGQTCTGCQYRNYHLQNNPTNAATAATPDLPALYGTISQTALLPYSTDLDPTGLGRLLLRGGAVPSNPVTPTTVANWRYPVTTTTCSFKAGTAYVNLYAVPSTLNPNDGGQLTVQLRYETATAGAYADWGSPVTFSTASWGYSTYAPVVIPVSVPALALASGKKVELQVAVPGAAPTDMRLAYNTTTYDAVMELPVTSGVSC